MAPKKQKRTGSDTSDENGATTLPNALTRQLKSRLDEEAPPLANPVVLSLLFEMLTFTDLKTIRQVCKQWCDISLGHWRRSAVLQVTFLTHTEVHYFGCHNAVPEASLHPILSTFPKILEKPFSSVNVVGPLTECRPLAPIIMPNLSFKNLTYLKVTLRNLCISHVGELVFSDNSPPLKTFILASVWLSHIDLDGHLDAETIQDLFPRANNTLTTFELGHCEFEFKPVRQRHGRFRKWSKDDFVRAFLLKAPNLQTLITGPDNPRMNKERGETFLSGLKLSRLKLNTLNINGMDGEYPRGFLPLLREFPLQELRLNVNSMYTIEDFRTVFGKNGESLRRLQLCRWELPEVGSALRQDPTDQIMFPNLEKLHIEDGIKTMFGILSLLNCPKLSELSLDYQGDAYGTERFDLPLLEQIEMVVPSVTRLQISRKPLSNLLTPREIQQIARIFPNVQHLRMAMTKAQFRAVCKWFQGLESLHILSFDSDFVYTEQEHEVLDDEGVTGLPEGSRDGAAREPNITDLAKLREFSLRPEPLEKNAYLTDHSVTNGFLRLPQLYNLKFNMTKISKTGRAALKQRVFIVNNYPKANGNVWLKTPLS